MTDKEALDALAAEMNAEPVDEYRIAGWNYVRQLLRSTGRTVRDAIPPGKDTEPTSGYG